MNKPAVFYEIDEYGIATLTLNKAERHNAFDEQMITQLLEGLKVLENDPSVRLLKLKAEGKSFSAGADLNWMRAMAHYSKQENYVDALQLASLMYTLYHFNKPTIAVVQGSAFGGGVGLVACCDIAIAVKEAKFCLSEVKLGLIPAAISPYVIAKMGESAARRYFLTAESFDALEAQRLELVHTVTEANNLEKTVDTYCERLLKNSPAALIAAKKLISYVVNTPFSTAMSEKTAAEIAQLRVSAEGQEGLRAFLEARTPTWVQK